MVVQLWESNYLVPLLEQALDSKAGFNRLKATFLGHSLTPLGSLYLTEAFTQEIVRCQPLVISATSNLSSLSCLYIESCHFRLFTRDYFGRWFGSCFHLRNLWCNCLLWYRLRHVSHMYIFTSTLTGILLSTESWAMIFHNLGLPDCCTSKAVVKEESLFLLDKTDNMEYHILLGKA